MTQCLVTEEEKGLVEKVCTGGTARWLREFLDSAWRPSVGFGSASWRRSVIESRLPNIIRYISQVIDDVCNPRFISIASYIRHTGDRTHAKKRFAKFSGAGIKGSSRGRGVRGQAVFQATKKESCDVHQTENHGSNYRGTVATASHGSRRIGLPSLLCRQKLPCTRRGNFRGAVRLDHNVSPTCQVVQDLSYIF